MGKEFNYTNNNLTDADYFKVINHKLRELENRGYNFKRKENSKLFYKVDRFKEKSITFVINPDKPDRKNKIYRTTFRFTDYAVKYQIDSFEPEYDRELNLIYRKVLKKKNGFDFVVYVMQKIVDFHHQGFEYQRVRLNEFNLNKFIFDRAKTIKRELEEIDISYVGSYEELVEKGIKAINYNKIVCDEVCNENE